MSDPLPIPCPNPAHGWRRSVARVTFPDSQFLETTACRSCAIWQLRTALDLGHSVLIEPLAKAEPDEDPEPEWDSVDSNAYAAAEEAREARGSVAPFETGEPWRGPAQADWDESRGDG